MVYTLGTSFYLQWYSDVMAKVVTTVSVDRDTWADLQQVRADIARAEHTTLTLGQVISLLIEAFRQGATHGPA